MTEQSGLPGSPTEDADMANVRQVFQKALDAISDS